MSRRQGGHLQALLDEAVESGLLTAAVGRAGTAEDFAWQGRAGRIDPLAEPEGGVPDETTLFDLASITKSFTGGLAAVLDREGLLPLATSVGQLLPEAVPELASVTLSELLSQRAGYRPWLPLYELCERPVQVLAILNDSRLLGAEPGTYSDLGFVLYGLLAERAAGRSLAALFRQHLLDPLGLGPEEISLPGAELSNLVVARCRCDGEKEAEVAAGLGLAIATPAAPRVGQPQDGNARFLGRTCAHAGLFGSLEGVWRWACSRLAAPLPPQQDWQGPFSLGWARPGAWPKSTEGLAEGSFGVLGFVGGSLWIDPRTGRISLLLAHRARPDPSLAELRSRFHRLALAGP